MSVDMTVVEYVLKRIEGECIEVPKGTQILDMDYDDGKIVLLLKVDYHQHELERRVFQSFPTGSTIHANTNYIGTFKPNNRSKRHLFEIL